MRCSVLVVCCWCLFVVCRFLRVDCGLLLVMFRCSFFVVCGLLLLDVCLLVVGCCVLFVLC